MSSPPEIMPSVFPDDELVAAARAGSSDAMGLLLQSCRTYLLAISESELSAELRIKVSPSDLVQETFAEGQRSMPNFSGSQPEEFLAWLRGILMHKVAHSRRRFLGTAARDLGRESIGRTTARFWPWPNESSTKIHLAAKRCAKRTIWPCKRPWAGCPTRNAK